MESTNPTSLKIRSTEVLIALISLAGNSVVLKWKLVLAILLQNKWY